LILTFISNNIDHIIASQKNGIQRIMLDLEKKTKIARQKDKGLFLTDHTLEDLKKVTQITQKDALVVRVNSIHNNSYDEINSVLKFSPSFLMLPYFTKLDEVREFMKIIDKRSQPILLFENKESIANIEEYLKEFDISEIFIGLNDLSLSLGYQNIFQVLKDPLFKNLISVLNNSNVNWGLGGVGNLFSKNLPMNPIKFLDYQLCLGSTRGLLSRNFRSIFSNPEPEKNLIKNIREINRHVNLIESTKVNYKQELRKSFELMIE